jgi:uncharacterized phage infection (PIP) family protein YhgE
MDILRKVFQNKLFWAGLLIPLIFHAVFLSIVIPALKNGNTNIANMKVAVVNTDQTLGTSIAAVLIEKLPYKTDTATDLNASLDAMNDNQYNMVIYIPDNFTVLFQQGKAQITYYVNQTAPSMTKQAMEVTATKINQLLNENAFNSAKEIIKQNAATGLRSAGLSEQAAAAIKTNISQAFDSLNYNSIASDIQKVNNSDGFVQTVLPFLLFLIYFIGSILMTVVHKQVFNTFQSSFSKWKLFLVRLAVNVAAALIVPGIAIAVIAAFDIPFNINAGNVWLVLAAGFLTLTLMVQMFIDWFSTIGTGLAILILFPLQLVTSGLIFSREIMPAFYDSIRNILPSTYFGSGMLKMFYGGASISYDIGILMLMSGIFILIILASPAMWKKRA